MHDDKFLQYPKLKEAKNKDYYSWGDGDYCGQKCLFFVCYRIFPLSPTANEKIFFFVKS